MAALASSCRARSRSADGGAPGSVRHRSRGGLETPSAERDPRPLRVCVVRYFWFELDSRVQRMTYALADHGAEVDVVCLSEPGEVPVDHGAVRIHRADRSRITTTSGAREYVLGYARFLALAALKIAVLDRRRRFDLIQVHTMPDALAFAAAAPKLRGVPLLLDVHDTFPELFATRFGRGPGDRLVRLVEREEALAAAVADRMLAVTEEARDRLASRGAGGGKTEVVMNSPDERVFGPPRSPIALPPSGPVRCVYHGGLAPRFGLETLVRGVGIAHQRRPELSLDVYGMGDERAEVAALAATTAPAAVRVADAAVPFESIPAKLAEAHVGVVPTLHDGFTELLLPVKLLEYVHMGLPVVVSRLPTIERYFGPDEVEFYEPGSPASLAAALERVCADPAAARARAARASARLTEIGWPVQRRRYLAVVDELVGTPRAGAG